MICEYLEGWRVSFLEWISEVNARPDVNNLLAGVLYGGLMFEIWFRLWPH